jgi:hypothetical protein
VLLGRAHGALCVGIGGGGDVVGALGVAELARALGTPARVGGVTWERRPIDPRPGPRTLAEIGGVTPLHAAAALAGPAAGMDEDPGFRFAEGRMAEHLGEETVLIDPHPGPEAVAEGLATAARRLDCDLVVLVDVGGDVLGHGDEPELASPLCDAVLLAAAEPLTAAGVEVLGALFGPGCDGELRPEQVSERVAEVWRAGGSRGAAGLSPAGVEVLEAAVAVVPTEASAQAVACARGEFGRHEIRGGRRAVHRSPLGAITFFFDPAAAMASAARCAALVRGASSLDEANERIVAAGVRTELDWERNAAAPV